MYVRVVCSTCVCMLRHVVKFSAVSIYFSVWLSALRGMVRMFDGGLLWLNWISSIFDLSCFVCLVAVQQPLLCKEDIVAGLIDVNQILEVHVRVIVFLRWCVIARSVLCSVGMVHMLDTVFTCCVCVCIE